MNDNFKLDKEKLLKKRLDLKEQFLREEISAEEYHKLKNELEKELEELERNKENIEETKRDYKHKIIHEKPKQDTQTNIWKYTSIILGILLIISISVNIFELNKSNSDTTITDKTKNDNVPPQNTNTNRITVSSDDDPSIGPANAPVTIIEFSDFQCPYCERAEPAVKQILGKYKDKVKFIYRDFPLGFHPYAQKAAEASECADEQKKYWEYHDLLFKNQNALDIESLKKYAKELKLDESKFNKCLESGKYASETKKDFEDGQKAGVSGTPTFFINGIKVVGAQPYAVFEQVIEQELSK